MSKRAPLALAFALALAFPLVVALAALRPVPARATSCMGGTFRWETVSLEATYLTQATDLLGHGAVFLLDARGALLGPLDLRRHPRAERGTPRPARLPAKLRTGTRGLLRYMRLVGPGARTPLAGYFGGFRARGAALKADATLLARVTDPFVVGLLAGGAGPLADPARARVRALNDGHGRQRDALMSAALGLLYAATAARAATLLAPLRYRDVAGAELTLVAALHRGGLRGLARHKMQQRYDWTDYLPALAAAWLGGQRKLVGVAEAQAFGQAAPHLPEPPRSSPYGMRCPPFRHQLRGPFAARSDVDGYTIFLRLQQVDRRFAEAVRQALTGLASGHRVYLLDKLPPASKGPRGWSLLVGRSSSWFVVEVDAAQARKLAVGTRLDLVARRKERGEVPASRWFPHLAVREITVHDVGPARRVVASGPDPQGLLAALRSAVRAGHRGYSGGFALQALHTLARRGSVPGWTLEAWRKLLLSLPGNRYRTFWRYTQDWGGMLRWALRYSSDVRLAGELDRLVPMLLARIVAQSDTSRPLRHGALFDFAAGTAAASALLRLRSGDAPGAVRVLMQRAAGDLRRLLPAGTRVGPTTRTISRLYLLRPLRVLALARAGRQAEARRLVPAAASEQRSDWASFERSIRPLSDDWRRRFRKALAAAGYAQPRRP